MSFEDTEKLLLTTSDRRRNITCSEFEEFEKKEQKSRWSSCGDSVMYLQVFACILANVCIVLGKESHLHITRLKTWILWISLMSFLKIFSLNISGSYYTCDTVGNGHNGHNPGDKCHFPFTYGSIFSPITRHSCITDGNGGVYWCYTIPNGKVGDPWADCDMDSCQYGRPFLSAYSF